MRTTLGIAATMAATLVAPVATLLAVGGVTLAIPIAVVAWATYAACWLNAGRIWTDVEPVRSRGALLGGTVLSLVAFVVGFFANYWFSIDRELCGEGAAEWIALAVAFGVYLAAGLFLLRRASRLLWAWPLLVLVGWVVSVAARAVLPGGHGFCET